MMKKIKLPAILTLTMLFLGSSAGISQTMDWTRQIITINSGKFEFSPPMQDFVTVQSFNPATQAVNEFNTIFTQSAQDILIHGNIAYVTAQDSIIKYNLNTYKRVVAVADSGLGKLAIFHNCLIVSKQYPLSEFFVEVLDTATLSLIARVDNISGDCSGITSAGDTVYVAVNGGWMGTEGKIAVIDPSSWTLTREINLGPEAIGIYNLYTYGGKIYSVNKTPYGFPAIGSISAYNPANGSWQTRVLNVKVGNGTGIMDSTLYLMMNEGIGSFQLKSMQIDDTTIIRDPGSASFKFILSSAVDTLNERFYANIGDFVTPGYCLVSSLTGDSITSYPTGISSDVAGIDYREYPQGISDRMPDESVLLVYPNPAVEMVTLHYLGKQRIHEVLITDIFGKVVFHDEKRLAESGIQTISTENLPPGLYCITLRTTGIPVIAKFLKR
jgi:hypothetical protein